MSEKIYPIGIQNFEKIRQDRLDLPTGKNR